MMIPRAARLLISAFAFGLMSVAATAVEVQLFRASPDAPTQALLETFISHPALREADIVVKEGPLPGDPRDVLVDDGVRLALVSLDRLVATGLVKDSPVVSALMQPGQFPSNRTLFDTQDSVLGEALLAEVGRGRQLIGIGYWSRGQTALVTTSPIRSVEDFKNRRIRTAFVSDVANANVRALGANTIVTTVAQAQLALERGEFDTAEFTPDAALTVVERRQARMSLATQYRPILGVLLAEQNGWDRLSERQKAAISEAATAADAAARKSALQNETRLESTARAQGMPVINLARIDATGFRLTNERLLFNTFGDRSAPGLQLIQINLAAAQIEKRPQLLRGPAFNLVTKPTILFITDRIDEGGKDSRSRFGSKQSTEEPTLTCGQAGYVTGSTRDIGTEYAGPVVLTPTTLPTGAAACSGFVVNILKQTKRSRVLLFIHGYNNTFDFAIRRAIASSLDIGFNDVVLVWSWPAEGHGRAYMRDEAAARRSSRHVVSFVQTLLDNSEIGKLDIIAHSMGNRIALVVLDELRKSKTPTNLSSIVFASADEERGVFADIFRAVGRDAPNLGGIRTLYAAQYDRPLQLSAMLHGDKRVGLGGKDIMIMAGVESIDATDVEGGHAHVFDVSQAINDLKNLLMGGKLASERGLLRRPSGKNEYWAIPKK